jgi:hypothetical protein
MPVDLGGCSSFGATGPLEMALGLLSITALIAGPERAVLDASLRPPAEPALFGPGWRETVIARNRDYMKAIAFEDVSVTDDHGASYVLRTREKAGFPVSMLRPFRTAVDLVLELEPLPPPGRAWFELRSPAGSPIRLLAADRSVPRAGAPVPLPGSNAPGLLPGLRKQCGPVSSPPRANCRTRSPPCPRPSPRTACSLPTAETAFRLGGPA